MNVLFKHIFFFYIYVIVCVCLFEVHGEGVRSGDSLQESFLTLMHILFFSLIKQGLSS